MRGTDLRAIAQQCFFRYYEYCLRIRATQQAPSLEALLATSVDLIQRQQGRLDVQAQQELQNLLQTGAEIYLFFAGQGQVFVGIDDRRGVMCLACAGTLQGDDAIPDLFAYCQRYAVCDISPVAGRLNCEICNVPLIPPGFPGANPPLSEFPTP